METDELIEIKSGLKAGDLVVMTRAYLLNCEYIFNTGASLMGNEKCKIIDRHFRSFSQACLTSISISLWGINTPL